MGYEHLRIILETKFDEVIESSAKNLLPIPSEYEVTFDDESECDVPDKDESSLVFTTFSNLLFNYNDDFTSSDDKSLSDEDVPIEEFKVYSNPLFDDEEINSNEIDPHCFNVESDFVESLSNRDTLIDSSSKFDFLEEFSGAFMPTSIADEERIRRENAEYISLMERLFTINPCPRPMENSNTIVETLPTSPIPFEGSDSQREEIDMFTGTDDLLPPSIESNDYDSEWEIYVLEELLVDDSFSLPENELFHFDLEDDPSFPRPPPEPPDDEFDFETNSGEEIAAVMNNIDELNEDECFDPGGEIDVFANLEDDNYFPFIFVIRIFLPCLIYPEVSPLLLSARSEDTIFDLAPTKGYGDAIVVSKITADNFELKHGLLTLVQNKQFYGHDKEDPHAHICYFNKITATLKFPNVPNTSIKLILFPFSLEGAARIWLEKEPPRSILAWDDLVSKFINHEAWDRFKDLLRACPHHGFSELHQPDMFYNALTPKDQDSLNSAAGGNFLDKMPSDCLSIIESKSKVRYSRDKTVAKVSMNASTSGVSLDVAELKDLVRALLLDKKGQNQSPAPVKAVKESCVTCSGAHSYHNCPATDGNVYRGNIQEFVSQASAVNYNQGNTEPLHSNQNRGTNFNQGLVYQPSVFQQPAYQAPAYQALAPQTRGVLKEDFSSYVKANDAFVNSNTVATSSPGTLPSNTIANPKSDLKAITTRSGVSYDGPLIPPPMVENEPEAIKDTVILTNNGNTKDLQPQVVQSKYLVSTSEPSNTPVSASKPNPQALIPYPSMRNDERNREKAKDQIEKIDQIFKDMSMAECLALADLGASNNLMPYSMWKRLSLPELTPTGMTLELANRSISQPIGVAEDVYMKVGSFYFSADFVVVDFDADPQVPLILGRSFLKTERALIDVFEGELTLRVRKEAITFNLDQTSRYSTNYNDTTAKIIDVIDMACEEYSQEVLGFSDTISSGNPTPSNDPIVSATSLTLTLFEDSYFLLEEVDAFLAVEDEPTSSQFQQSYLESEGDILLLEAFLNEDPSSPPLSQKNQISEVSKELKMCETETEKSSVDEPPAVELKFLPPHIEYAFLEGDDKLPVIIAKDLIMEEKAGLIMVLKFHKRAIMEAF
nr:reverse transcriptase domain-containing protein [Tanacetum cinerariifolium]